MSNNRGVFLFVARRLAFGVLTLFVVSLVVFTATQLLPSDPAQAILGRDANPTSVASLRTKLGLDHSAFYQYTHWLKGIVVGDPGDSFNARVPILDYIGDRVINPRDAYPLYYAIGNLVWRIAGGEAAFGGNLASAICGALACGALTWVAAELTGSLVAAAAGGLLLATSYTFWTQCVIAEVYALHLLMMGLVLTALLWWDRHRTRARLGLVFAVYALSFGNHLMTVLMAPAIILFVASAPGGVRLLFSRRTIGMALAIAAAGACQYVWNASYLWALPDPPATPLAFARAFWFDVTKSDWRETMVMGVHHSVLMRRSSMYLFDLTQQFGTPGIVLALLGLGSVVRRPRLLLLLLSAWVVPFVFAYTYNVGDSHVFFLPSHQIVALLAACGVAALLTLAPRAWPSSAVGVLTVLSALVRWRWSGVRGRIPAAVDRHADRRPVDWLSAVAATSASISARRRELATRERLRLLPAAPPSRSNFTRAPPTRSSRCRSSCATTSPTAAPSCDADRPGTGASGMAMCSRSSRTRPPRAVRWPRDSPGCRPARCVLAVLSLPRSDIRPAGTGGRHAPADSRHGHSGP